MDQPQRDHATPAPTPTTEPSVTELEVRGLVVGIFQENCWVLGNRRTREAICIDPGDQAADILHLAADMGVTIKRIAASHAHIDHVMGVRDLQAATGAPFLLHAADLDLLRHAAASARLFGIAMEPPPEPDHLLRDNDRLEVDGIALRVLHTPGHTPGSACFFTNDLLFTGDTLFRASIGRTDLPGGDFAQEMESILTQLLRLPEETTVLPGHMQQTTIGHERATNPFILEALQRRSR